MKVKTHLIVTDQYDEYGTRWVRPLSTVEPEFNGQGTLTFAIISLSLGATICEPSSQ